MTQQTWLTSVGMAQQLGINHQHLLAIRRKSTIFKQGRDYRFKGLASRGPIQWNAEATEKTFTSYKRVAPQEVETFSEVAS